MENNLKAIDFLIAKKSIIMGLLASLVLLLVYFSVLTFVSGFSFTLDQFSRYWYFIISLSVGFGIQIFLYFYLPKKLSQFPELPQLLPWFRAAHIILPIFYLLSGLPVL